MSSQISDEELQKYIDLSKDVINKFVTGKNNALTIFDITTIAMGVVEKIKDDKHLSGGQKKSLALEILTIVIDTLVSLKNIDSDKGDELKKAVQDNITLIMQFIDIAAFLTKNPQIINAGKFVVDQSRKVCGKCFSCCSLT